MADPTASAEPLTIFAAHCPFRRDGSPVLGNMGSTVKSVIIIETETWKELLKQVPALGGVQFRVGTL